jgi:hypothetical protein
MDRIARQRTGLAFAMAGSLLAFALAPLLDRLATPRTPDLSLTPHAASWWAGRRAGDAGLASWQTIGGCGAGAGSGAGAGLKWIGRNVTGGLFTVESQASYTETAYGHDYSANTLVRADLAEEWALGVNVPYLYKFIRDPYQLNVDVANRGAGDVGVMLTRKVGAINDTSVTAMLGLPTGTHEAKFRTELLHQERQLGLGKPTATLTIDHIIDNIWGPVVLGGTASWRGGENELGNYRAPSASLYAYASHLVGPFAPALGVVANGWKDHDRDRGGIQRTPLFSAVGQVSVEWSTDWAALLVGATLPYQYSGPPEEGAKATNPWSLGHVLFGAGLSLAPF